MRGTHAYLTGVAIAVLVLAAGPASAQLLKIGGGDTSLVTVGGGGGGGIDANVDVNLGDVVGDDDSDVLDVDLFGKGGADVRVTANLFGDSKGNDAEVVVDLGGGNDPDVILDLFGRSDGELADVTLGGTSGLDVDIAVGRSGNAVPDLFGQGGGNGGGDSAIIDLFGNPDQGTDGTTTASIGGQGRGSGGTGPGNSSVVPARSVGGNARLVANAAAGADARSACFSPDAEQIDHLLARNSYSASLAASWDSAAQVNVVPIDICPDARARVAAAVGTDANIGFMQAKAASNQRIRAAIMPAYTPGDVLAIDSSGDQLTVYVY